MNTQTDVLAPAQAYYFTTAHDLQDLYIKSEKPTGWAVDGDATTVQEARHG